MKKLLLIVALLLPTFAMADGPCSSYGISAFVGAALPFAYSCQGKFGEIAVRDKTMTALMIGTDVLHIADYSETKYAIGEGYAHERNPFLRPLLSHEPAGIAFKAGWMATQNIGLNYLLAHNHRKWALVIGSVGFGVQAWVVQHNATVILENRRGAR